MATENKGQADRPAIKTSTVIAIVLLMICVCIALMGVGVGLLFSTCENPWIAFVSKPAGMGCLALAWILWPVGSRRPEDYDSHEDHWE